MRRVVAFLFAVFLAGLAVCGPWQAIAGMDGLPQAADRLAEADEEDEEDEEDEDAENAESTADERAQGGASEGGAASNPDPELVAQHLLFFSGADIWRNGLFSHTGVLWAYQGLNANGPVLKLLLNGGLYRYRSGRKDIVGFQTMGAVLPGWRWHWPGLEITVFAGLDAQDHRYLPDDRTNRLRGTRLGLRGGFDVWYEPFQDAMLTASASLSTVGKSYWTRAATGLRVFDMIWLGPEFLASGDDRYRELRVGAHLTSFRFSTYEFAVGAGWATDSDHRSSAYGRFGMIYRPFYGPTQHEKPVPF